MLRRAVLLVILSLLAVLGAATALAAPPVECPPGTTPDPASGECIIIVTDPGGGGGGGDGHNGGGGGSTGSAKPSCTFTLGSQPKDVPCTSKDGYWSQSQQAYCRAAAPQPPLRDPAWGGRTEGQIYTCTRPINAGAVEAVIFDVWMAEPPRGAPPDPKALARKAIVTMRLKAIPIGIVPEPKPGSVGLVGMPVWLWNAKPGPSTWGPVTKAASAGAYTVTATAKVDEGRVGDGRRRGRRVPAARARSTRTGTASSPARTVGTATSARATSGCGRRRTGRSTGPAWARAAPSRCRSPTAC